MANAKTPRDAGRADKSGDWIGSLDPVLAQARDLLGVELVPEPPEKASDESLLAILDVASDHVRALVDDDNGKVAPSAAAMLALDLQDVREGLRDRLLLRRVEGLGAVQEALAELRTVGSVERMLELSTSVICAKCGFDGSILMRVDGSELVPASAFKRDDPDYMQRLLRFAASVGPARLHHELIETDMVRRRTPIIVHDVENDPRVVREWVDVGGPTSYVAAPIAPQGRVIGVIHADVHLSEREVDEIDRDILWAFAEGYGYALERTVLLERLHAQRDQVVQLVRSTEAVLGELTDAELQLAKAERAETAVASSAASIFVAPETRIKSLLTKRELEVLELMTDGSTNREIANRLVVSEGTVKSHVKHILRKLRASNRAEAVARFMRMTGPGR